jgi:AraC-like DNA-binding protein
MKIIATVILAFMTVALVSSGALLWKRRKETSDWSRIIWAVFSWISAFFTLTFIMRTWLETTTADGAFFEPEHTFVPILFQMTFFLYPLEVIRPTIGRIKSYVLLFAPLLILVVVGMCAGIEYTPIYTYSDLWQHIGEFNVWYRLFALLVMLLYCFSLFLVPYDWHRSSADKKFITFYSCGFCLIGLLHFSIQMSHAYWLVLAHQVVWITFFITVAWYELRERLLVPQDVLEQEESCDCDSVDDVLWREITLLLNNNEKWRDPNLSLSSLSEVLESNRTYVGEAFKRNTGMTFIEYLTKHRIDYIVARIKDDPKADIHELFNHVGYRQRSTAWRNFQKITGMTPTEFVNNLK